MQDALRLAERIAKQHAGAALLDVCLPPVVDVGINVGLRLPAVDRHAKSRFGDEGVATHRFKWQAGAVGLNFVVARGNPDFAAVFHADLC